MSRLGPGRRLSRLLGLPCYIVARKSVKPYMEQPLVDEVNSITTQKTQTLCLDGKDALAIHGKRVALVDDVISTGESLQAIERLVEKAGAEVVARAAILAGAQYVVSPYFNAETQRLCNRYRVACMPGAMSIAEVVAAMEAGADLIKIFPGELFGPKILKAIHGPIPQAELMPTGGVSLDNVEAWIQAGAVAVGAGGSLTGGAKTGHYEQITETAKRFVEKIQAARAGR